jgi:hypothetical protein
MVGDFRFVWIAFLSMNEIRELYPVPDEENGSIVPDHVPVAFLGVELYCESSRIAFCIPRALLAADCGKADEHFGRLAHVLKQFGFGPLSHILSNFEDTVCARSLGLDHAFQYALAIEMRHLFDEQ